MNAIYCKNHLNGKLKRISIFAASTVMRYTSATASPAKSTAHEVKKKSTSINNVHIICMHAARGNWIESMKINVMIFIWLDCWWSARVCDCVGQLATVRSLHHLFRGLLIMQIDAVAVCHGAHVQLNKICVFSWSTLLWPPLHGGTRWLCSGQQPHTICALFIVGARTRSTNRTSSRELRHKTHTLCTQALTHINSNSCKNFRKIN